jgi:hypothetical protein
VCKRTEFFSSLGNNHHVFFYITIIFYALLVNLVKYCILNRIYKIKMEWEFNDMSEDSAVKQKLWVLAGTMTALVIVIILIARYVS